MKVGVERSPKIGNTSIKPGQITDLSQEILQRDILLELRLLNAQIKEAFGTLVEMSDMDDL